MVRARELGNGGRRKGDGKEAASSEEGRRRCDGCEDCGSKGYVSVITTMQTEGKTFLLFRQTT